MKINSKEIKKLIILFLNIEFDHPCHIEIEGSNIIKLIDDEYRLYPTIKYRSAFLHADVFLNRVNFKIYIDDFYKNLKLYDLLDDFKDIIEKKLLN